MANDAIDLGSDHRAAVARIEFPGPTRQSIPITNRTGIAQEQGQVTSMHTKLEEQTVEGTKHDLTESLHEDTLDAVPYTGLTAKSTDTNPLNQEGFRCNFQIVGHFVTYRLSKQGKQRLWNCHVDRDDRLFAKTP